MKKSPLSLLLCAGLAAPVCPVSAALLEVRETGLAADKAAFMATDLQEDSLSFNDRVHQHNGPAFDEVTGRLSATGTVITGIPVYLIGGDFVQFANDARENAGYSALVTADTPSTFYLLIDNRINGLTGGLTNPNNSDPVLGGTLQWVTDGGWERMNTGISPKIQPGDLPQPDYSGVDEAGNGTGPGQSVENFYSIYRFPGITTSVTVRNGATGGNMISVVAVPTAPPAAPIVSYSGSSLSVLPGGSVDLSWLIAPNATAATITPGVGDILPLNDALGAGKITVSPVKNTTYTLSVTTPSGTDARPLTVQVQPLATYTGSRQRIDAGESVTLNWKVRPDATVTIDGAGDLAGKTDANGTGSVTVTPAATRDYVIHAEAEGLAVLATAGVYIRPAGPSFALLDFGGTGGRAEPGTAGGKVIGAGASGLNLTDLPPVTLLSDTGGTFTVAMDALDAGGNAQGGLDWRDRGDGLNLALNRLAEDFVKNGAGHIRVTLGELPAGTYDVVSYHLDPDNSQAERINITVSDANGANVDTGVFGNASYAGHPANTGAPLSAGLTTGLAESHTAKFQIKSNGTSEVHIHFSSPPENVDREVPLSGLRLTRTGARPVDNTWALIDLGGLNAQAEPGSATGAVVGLANQVSGNLEPVDLTSRTGAAFQIALDNQGPDGTPAGGLDWRDRGDTPDGQLAWLVKDFVKNNLGMVRVRLLGLPAGTWQIRSYHLDPTLSQGDNIRVFVTDATRTAVETGVVANASFPAGDAGAPQLNGIWPGGVEEHTANVNVTSNGTDEVVLYYDGTLGADVETPLAGLRITASTPSVPVTTIPVTNIARTVTGGTASVAITFTSEAGKTYSVYGSGSTGSWGAPLTTTLNATGTSTTYTEAGIPLATGRRFYQIRRN
ncbi:MAG: hypothetical protein V4726_09110 [Verrucomicrobiota bacterium]